MPRSSANVHVRACGGYGISGIVIGRACGGYGLYNVVVGRACGGYGIYGLVRVAVTDFMVL